MIVMRVELVPGRDLRTNLEDMLTTAARLRVILQAEVGGKIVTINPTDAWSDVIERYQFVKDALRAGVA